MDKIYSRKRLKLPNVIKQKYDNYSSSKKHKLTMLTIIIIAAVTAIIIVNNLNPIFNGLCTEKAKALATEIINNKSNSVFKNTSYDELVDVKKDEKRKYYNAKNQHNSYKHFSLKHRL